MILGNKELIELFGSDIQKTTYEKTKKVAVNTKISILNSLKSQYKIVEDLGRGRYKIDEKFDGSAIVPNDKINHPIYGKLIPSILLNVKRYNDNESVFCMPVSSIYIYYNMLHRNYSNIRNNQAIASSILDLEIENTKMFFDSVNTSLKYYMKNTLDTLSSLKLIMYRTMPYVIIKDEKFDKMIHRRATVEEEQFILNLISRLDKKYGCENGRDRYHGINSKAYIIEETRFLRTIGVERKYDAFEVFCKNKEEIIKILDFYNLTDGCYKNISCEFVENFTNITSKNSANKSETIVNREKFLEDHNRLIELTLNPEAEHIFIPKEIKIKGD